MAGGAPKPRPSRPSRPATNAEFPNLRPILEKAGDPTFCLLPKPPQVWVGHPPTYPFNEQPNQPTRQLAMRAARQLAPKDCRVENILFMRGGAWRVHRAKPSRMTCFCIPQFFNEPPTWDSKLPINFLE